MSNYALEFEFALPCEPTTTILGGGWIPLVHRVAPLKPGDLLKVPAFITYVVFVAHDCFCVVAVDDGFS
jgi:hypothetical protein